MARLVYKDQNGQERSVEIGPQRPRVTIGRNLDCIIHTNNASVSREHVVVSYQSGRLVVQDPPLGTPTNGTYINGQRLRPGEVGSVKDGDELRCGNFAIAVRGGDEEMVPQAPVDPYGNANYGGWSSQPAHPQLAQPPVVAQPLPTPQPPPRQPAPSMTPPGYPQTNYQQQSYPSPNPYAPQPVAYPPPAQVAPPAALDDADDLRRENMSLKVVEKRQREQIEQLQQMLADKDRAIGDMERRNEHHDNVVEGLNDKIAKLKEQVDLQKEQLRQYRDELKAANDRNEDVEFKLSSLQNALSSHDTASASAESQIADLKVQINQRDRRIDDLQRELDLAQYAITTERENVERLELTLRQGNSQLGDFERYRRDMQKVVEQHEATLTDLRRMVEERDREITRLGEALRYAERNAGADELRMQLEQYRQLVAQRDRDILALDTQLREAERMASRANDPRQAAEVEELRRTIEELEARGGGGEGDDAGRRELVRQLNELKREKRDLKLALDELKAQGGGGGASPDPELKRRIAELERELDETRRKLRDAASAPRPAAGRADDEGLKRRVRTVYEALNDVISQWRDDMQTIEGYVQDLKRLVNALRRTDLSGLPAAERKKLDGIMAEVDPQNTVEEMQNLVANNQSSANSLKGSLRELREIVV